MSITIRAMNDNDWPSVEAIYGQGIAAGTATFETETPGWDAWNAGHLQPCRLVAENDGKVVAWAALSAYSSRYVYRGVAGVSIYVAQEARGAGVGRQLLQALIETSEANGFWTLQAGIFETNTPSLKLHAGAGFRTVGVRDKIGQRAGQWQNVVLMERRSSSALDQ